MLPTEPWPPTEFPEDTVSRATQAPSGTCSVLMASPPSPFLTCCCGKLPGEPLRLVFLSPVSTRLPPGAAKCLVRTREGAQPAWPERAASHADRVVLARARAHTHTGRGVAGNRQVGSGHQEHKDIGERVEAPHDPHGAATRQPLCIPVASAPYFLASAQPSRVGTSQGPPAGHLIASPLLSLQASA